ncbi:MAG: DUF4836 family protein [Prevotella sp.]|nr:DUF4836 family protein [Prevotella sp.]
MRTFLLKMQGIAWLAVSLWLLSACSNDDYRNAIPHECTALVSVNMSQQFGKHELPLPKVLLKLSSIEEAGLDLSENAYLFETTDGTLGMCLKMSDADQFSTVLSQLSKIGICEKPSERRGYRFTLMADSWVAGYSDAALLLMGPVAKDGVLDMQNRMVRFLAQEEKQGILDTRIYEKLQAMDGAMGVVAQVQVLPEQLQPLFMLGTPKGADASQVYVSARMALHDGMLLIDGEPFSFNKSVDAYLQESAKLYRPVQGRYLPLLDEAAVMSMLVNVPGKDYLQVLQSNRSIQSLLAGINTAIDMDNILRSVDGEMLLQMLCGQRGEWQMALNAELAHTDWVRDVPYWKQSCPQGTRIEDWKKNAWHFSNGEEFYYFGVAPDKQFFCGSDESGMKALLNGATETRPMPPSLSQELKGHRLVMFLNLKALTQKQEQSAVVSTILGKVLGDVRYVVYRMK